MNKIENNINQWKREGERPGNQRKWQKKKRKKSACTRKKRELTILVNGNNQIENDKKITLHCKKCQMNDAQNQYLIY